MALPPFRIGAVPNVDAQLGNAYLLSALYHGDHAAADLYCNLVGAAPPITVVNPSTFPPDMTLTHSGNDYLVVLAGTTNLPQWAAHLGSAFFPVIDTSTGTFVVGSFYIGERSIENDILTSIGPMAGKTIRITGHSYGGAAAFILAMHLLNLPSPPPLVEVMTFGAPKAYGGSTLSPLPPINDRIVRTSDPVPWSPPGVSFLCGMGKLLSLIKLFGSASWRHYGTPWQCQNGDFHLLTFQNPGLLEDLQLVAQGTGLAFTQHPMDVAYLPDAVARYDAIGGDPALEQLKPTIATWTATPYVAPAMAGTAPTSADYGNAWFPSGVNPIDSANEIFWETVSSQAYYFPNGSSSMSQMKGTFLFHLGTGGFSESVYAVGQSSLGYAGMTSLMQQLLPLRSKLSMCGDQPGCANPLKCFAIRVEDELIPRDAQLTLVGGVLTGYSAAVQSTNYYAQNLEQNQAAKITFSTANAGQLASTYLHGVPTGALTDIPGTVSQTDAFNRYAPMAAVWRSYLKAYSDKIMALQLGYRYLNSPWDVAGKPGPQAYPIPGGVTYDAATETYLITMPQAPLTQRMRYVLRGFKNLAFLNGRWPGVLVTGNQIRILRKARNLTWDGTGTVSPEVWGFFSPNPSVTVPPTAKPGVSYKFITGKKIGSPFDLERGRARNRAV